MWDASLKRQNNPPEASAAFEAFGCRCLVFLVLAPACTAVRFGLLLSTLSRLTHIPYAVLDGSNFRALGWLGEAGSPQFGALSMRAPLSPRCTHYLQPRVGTMGAALNFGTRVPGNFGGYGCFAMQSGLFTRLGEYSNVGRESEKAKQPSFGIYGIRSMWLQAPSFPRARPRMYRREVWAAALNL